MSKLEQMERRILELEAKLDTVTVSQGGTSPWYEVREYATKEEEKLFTDHMDVYKFHTGLTTVLRFALGLKYVRDMTPEMVPQAKEVVDQLIGIVKGVREV